MVHFSGNIYKAFYQNWTIGYVVVYKWKAYYLTNFLDLFLSLITWQLQNIGLSPTTFTYEIYLK